MKFVALALSLATAVSTASAYAIEADGVNCRSGPSTSDKVVRTYNKGNDVKLECQTAGQAIHGDSLWDKTTDDCYVADYYVKTGTTNMVTGQCGGGGTINSKISRQEIIARGQYWVSKHVPYSMEATYPDQHGTRYRTDCSGFVTMALHATPPGYNTVSLPEIARPITWAELQPGDLVGTLGPGTGGAAGHVTLFHSWADASRNSYNTLECRGVRAALPTSALLAGLMGLIRRSLIDISVLSRVNGGGNTVLFSRLCYIASCVGFFINL